MTRARVVPRQLERAAQASADAGASQQRSSVAARASDKQRQQLQYVKPADAAANSTLETPITTWRRRVRVTRIFLMGAGVDEHATDFAAFIVQTTPPRSSTTTNVLVRNTKPRSESGGLGSWATWQEVLLAEPKRIFEVGSTLILAVQKGGNGVQLPALAFVIEYEELD